MKLGFELATKSFKARFPDLKCNLRVNENLDIHTDADLYEAIRKISNEPGKKAVVGFNVELAPDNERGATWDISGYKNSGRTLHLVCEYKDGDRLILPVVSSADRCYVTGRRQTAAWCEK
jgi:hypothetical protein